MAEKAKSLEMAPRKTPEASAPSRTPAPSISPSGFGLTASQGAAGNMAIQRAALAESGKDASVRSESALHFPSVCACGNHAMAGEHFYDGFIKNFGKDEAKEIIRSLLDRLNNGERIEPQEVERALGEHIA